MWKKVGAEDRGAYISQKRNEMKRTQLNRLKLIRTDRFGANRTEPNRTHNKGAEPNRTQPNATQPNPTQPKFHLSYTEGIREVSLFSDESLLSLRIQWGMPYGACPLSFGPTVYLDIYIYICI